MVCIFCNGVTGVVNSRWQKRPNSTWRRRKCLDCGRVITTIEALDADSILKVATSRSNIVQPFCRDKLFLSVYKALKHRPSAIDDASGLTATILQQIKRQHQDGIMQSGHIKAACLKTLKRFDKDAALQYRVYHR